MKVKLLVAALFGVGLSFGCVSKQHEVSIEADVSQQGPTINKDIYGQFAEHLGRGIYEGIWVGKDSDIPNTKGFRNDVLNALRDIKVPLVRWPGGCFADEYHWRDGIGDPSERPVKVNTHWGGVEEDNAVGTHEFFDFVELLGADAYVNGNLGSGTVREMAEWVEYMTSDKNSTLANERRANGRDEPWDIAYFGIGNESWGCGGHMSPEYYVNLYNQFATFIKTPPGKKPKLVGSGGHTEDTEWTDVLSANIERNMDGISYHFYTLPNSDWQNKGHATEFDQSDWFKTMERTYRMDKYLRDNIAKLEQNDPDGDIGLYVDEWGTWYDPEPDREPGFLYQQNTLRDAVLTAVNFNLFHDYADRVHMTNIAQMVNVLQAMILTDGADMLLTPTYHVYGMYKVFQDATAIPYSIASGEYSNGEQTLPAVTTSIARGTDGKVYIALVNLDPAVDAEINLNLSGADFASLSGQILTADAITAKNTFDAKGQVKPTAFTADADNFVLPAKSVVVAELK
ncbi:alpha-N-arabinofuranosidase [Alteromonas gilva]|uniref:non-reducing end alpha-L-arabinofuranosidase n=1 Tax=Alteromonas gilva TaxID=2987522 RepID=A0ABT5KY17_9ALTE|nr:alpha-L-arabinofuranosidase C-terminal domain-containing protein [Alteromonas gilva]MDC8829679.1 alpha-L-arabinofuranosidase C-terminal domain-containing protein [Alteromonas gilva]